MWTATEPPRKSQMKMYLMCTSFSLFYSCETSSFILMQLQITDNPLYTDIRVNDKICYNDNSSRNLRLRG